MESEREQAAVVYQALVREVAGILGWTCDPPWEDADVWAGIGLPTGERLTFYCSRFTGKPRLEISGRFLPNYGPYNSPHEITVAGDRTAFAIAADIQRRLLPGYLVAYQESAARETADKAAQARDESLATELAGICGAQVVRDNPDHFQLYGNLSIRGHSYDGGCDLQILRLPAELAARVLRMIREATDAAEAALSALPTIEEMSGSIPGITEGKPLKQYLEEISDDT